MSYNINQILGDYNPNVGTVVGVAEIMLNYYSEYQPTFAVIYKRNYWNNYAVGFDYDPINKTHSYGHYDFKTFNDAKKYIFKEYEVLKFVYNKNL